MFSKLKVFRDFSSECFVLDEVSPQLVHGFVTLFFHPDLVSVSDGFELEHLDQEFS